MVTRVKDRKVEESIKEHSIPKVCSHYWVIETCQGPTSHGVCKRCGEEKEFLNIIPEYSAPGPARDKNPLNLPKMEEKEFDEGRRRS